MTDKTNLQPDPTVIGNISAPPFVYLPRPEELFAKRAQRLRFLGTASPLRPYLDFVAGLTDAQGAVATGLPPAVAMDAPRPGMPVIDRDKIVASGEAEPIFERLFEQAEKIEKPQNAADALKRVAKTGAEERRTMARAVLSGTLPPETVAEHIYVWAGLQVHFTRVAAQLAPKALKPVADGVCPACGSLPTGSIVFDRPGAHGSRFCSCSLCNTLWHYVRIKCVCCGSTKGIGYQEVEEGEGFIKAETCDECDHWTKVIYERKSPGAEPMADDVASLGIDMLMRDLPYRRGGFAPLLAGL